jgi:IMP dehydrogenase/GMP reductase
MINIREGLTFDDVLLVPKYSEIKSRKDVNLSVGLSKGIGWRREGRFAHPIVPANMLSITGRDMSAAISQTGGLSILHRFMPLDEQIAILKYLREEIEDGVPRHMDQVGVSVGVKEGDYKNVGKLYDAGARIFCIDIAHGDSSQCIEITNYISKKFPDVFLIAGNVATAEGAKRLWLAGADAVKIGVGPGCFAAGTRILMANGFYKNIEEVVKGDSVINMNGKPVVVLNSFSTGIKKVTKLRTNVFYEDTYLTPDHNLWVGDLNSSKIGVSKTSGYKKILDLQSKTIPKMSKYKWKAVDDLKQDVLLLPKTIDFVLPEAFDIVIKKRKRGDNYSGTTYKDDSKIIPSYDSGYLFGTFLGDGHAMCAEFDGSHIGAVYWYFGGNEIDIATKVSKCIQTIFNKTPKIEKPVDKNVTNVIFYYKPLADFLFSFGKKTNKHLPEHLLVNNKEYLMGLYDGLIDSDGHIEKNGRVSLVNTSRYVIELFNVLTYLIKGHFPNSEKKAITTGGLTNCNIDNCSQPYISRPLQRPEYRHTKNYQVVKILDIKTSNIELPVYDLTIDCDTHSFIANNIIVHNSLCSTRIETGNGVPQLTALSDIADMRKKLTTISQGEYNPQIQNPIFIIADGGIKNAGDCVKALCFADMVMTGSLFAGSDETPGEILQIDGAAYKSYVGSSTHKTNHIEGVASIVKKKGSAKDIITKLCEGIRSGLSYQGVSNLTDLKKDPQFLRITNAGLKESHPHIDGRIV